MITRLSRLRILRSSRLRKGARPAVSASLQSERMGYLFSAGRGEENFCGEKSVEREVQEAMDPAVAAAFSSEA